jgi:predicted PurR-regulated permease PerM
MIGVAIVATMLVYLLAKIKIIFPPLVLALLIIYLLNPLVSRLEERGVPRLAATLLSFAVVLGGVSLIIAALIPYVSRQVESFADSWPQFRVQAVDFIDDTAESIEDRTGIRIRTTQLSCLLGADDEPGPDAPSRQRCDEVVEDFRDRLVEGAGDFTAITRGLFEGLLIFILAPLLALYLLVDLPQLQRDALNLVPESHRPEVADLASKIGRAVGGFFRGQLFVALMVGVMSAVGFAIIGLPFWLVIGAIAGFFNLIPLVGPFIGGFIGFLVGAATGGIGLGLKAALVELIVQQIDNHIISPNVMRRAVHLHPATVMVALLAGGAIGGFWGVFLGVPAVAVAKLLTNHLWTTRVLGVAPSPHSAPAVVAGGMAPSIVPDPAPPPEPDES